MCALHVSVNACLCVINDFKGGEGGTEAGSGEQRQVQSNAFLPVERQMKP